MEVEVRFTVPLKSVAEIPISAGSPPRAIFVSLLRLNLS